MEGREGILAARHHGRQGEGSPRGRGHGRRDGPDIPLGRRILAQAGQVVELAQIELEQGPPPMRVGQHVGGRGAASDAGGALAEGRRDPDVGPFGPADDVGEFAPHPRLDDRGRRRHAQDRVIVLDGQGGHAMPLELGEGRGGEDQLESQVGVLELAGREVVELHPLEDGQEHRPPAPRGHPAGIGQARAQGAARDRVEESGQNAVISVGSRGRQADGRLLPSLRPAAAPAGAFRRPGLLRQRAVRLGVERGGLGEEDDRRGRSARRFEKARPQGPDFGQRMGGEAADHQLQVAGVDRHTQLALGGQADDIAGVLLGPPLQQRLLLGIRGRLRVSGEDHRAQLPVEAVVERVLGLDRADEVGLGPGRHDLLRDDEILAQGDVALGLLREGGQTEPLHGLDRQAAEAHQVEVEDGVLGHRVVAHLEDDGPVRAAGLLHLAAGGPAQLVDRAGVAGDAGVGGGQRLGRQVEARRCGEPQLVERVAVDVVPG